MQFSSYQKTRQNWVSLSESFISETEGSDCCKEQMTDNNNDVPKKYKQNFCKQHVTEITSCLLSRDHTTLLQRLVTFEACSAGDMILTFSFGDKATRVIMGVE